MVAIAGIVGDDGQFAGALFMEGLEQMIRDTDSAEAGHQHRRPVANPGHGVGDGLHTLVDHLEKAPSMRGIFVRSPWLTPEPG